MFLHFCSKFNQNGWMDGLIIEPFEHKIFLCFVLQNDQNVCQILLKREIKLSSWKWISLNGSKLWTHFDSEPYSSIDCHFLPKSHMTVINKTTKLYILKFWDTRQTRLLITATSVMAKKFYNIGPWSFLLSNFMVEVMVGSRIWSDAKFKIRASSDPTTQA